MEFFGSLFSRFWTEYGDTEIYGVNLRIQFQYGEIRTGKNFTFGYFSHSEVYGLTPVKPQNYSVFSRNANQKIPQDLSGFVRDMTRK